MSELVHRQIIKTLTLFGIGVVATLLMSCRQATNDTNLALLEWTGYEYAKYYPEYFAKYGRGPDYTFFAEAEDAMRRMRNNTGMIGRRGCAGKANGSTAFSPAS